MVVSTVVESVDVVVTTLVVVVVYMISVYCTISWSNTSASESVVTIVSASASINSLLSIFSAVNTILSTNPNNIMIVNIIIPINVK